MIIDGTIKIDTLILAGTIIVSGTLAYASLDRRISIVEQLTQERSHRVEQQLRELQDDMRELTKAVNSKTRQNDKN